MLFPSPTSLQEEIIHLPPLGKTFLEGPAGAGKTTAAVQRLLYLINQGIPADQILVLAPQRSLGAPYSRLLRQPELPAGGVANVVTLGGLGQRLIDLFWAMIAPVAGFSHPDRPPTFLTLETAQYYMARLVEPLFEQGYFESVKIERNRLLSQVIDNLNKAAAVGIDSAAFAARLQSAWVGDPAQLRVYAEAQVVANRFRVLCLENNLLDYSLQLEVFTRHLWPAMLCRQYLKQRYRHLIYDNLEEDVPVVHDIIAEWLPDFESALLIYDSDGGYRSFLGADPQNGYQLASSIDRHYRFEQSFVVSKPVADFQKNITGHILRRPLSDEPLDRTGASLSYHRYTPEMVNWIGAQISRLVFDQSIPPGEIAVLAPFMPDSLRFSLVNRLHLAQVNTYSYRPSRSLREEPATHCLLTLAALCHPQWGLAVSRQQVRNALVQAIADLDLVRADLLARIVYRETRPEEGLAPFDQLIPEMRDRITYQLGYQRYEVLRNWLMEYRAGQEQELDVFLSRLFGELLSQPNFGFHASYDAAAVTARLIESIQKFRWAAGESLRQQGISTGAEYIRMVLSGVIAALNLESVEEAPQDAVLLAPAYTFLMMNRPVTFQFWLDIGSPGWWERLLQPLTHPHILSRRWPEGALWTDLDEYRTNQEALVRLVTGLTRRCQQHIYLCVTNINQEGHEQRGPLLQAVQGMLRNNLISLERNHV
ncbi:MAG: hypothetical protein ROW39_07255 [Anaerolineaceae bacterium]